MKKTTKNKMDRIMGGAIKGLLVLVMLGTFMVAFGCAVDDVTRGEVELRNIEAQERREACQVPDIWDGRLDVCRRRAHGPVN